MTGFKQTEIGTLPEDWEIKRIGDFCDIRSSSILFSEINKIKEQSGSLKVLALKVSDMNLEGNENEIKTAQIEFYLKENSSYIRYLIPPFALIFPKRGAAISTNKKRIIQCYSILDPNLMALIPNQTCNLNYLYHYFQRFDLRTITDKGLVPQLNKKDLLPLVVPLPSLSEQSNIAKILSIIQSAIETQEKIIQTTTELKKALMQKLFTEGLHGEAQKETEIGLVPKSWEISVFEDIVTLQRGKDLPKDKFVQGEFPVGGSNGIIGYHNQFNTKAPGITVGRSGSCGKVVFYDKNFWAHNTALVVKDFHGNNEKFTYYFLCFLKLEKYKSGVSVPTLNRNAFRTIEMAIPKIDEQIEIAKTLEQIDKKITMAIEKKNVLQSLFKSMLHHLMTGQIRVKDIRFS